MSAPTVTLWVCCLTRGVPDALALDSAPVTALRSALGGAVVSVSAGPARWFRLELTVGAGRETPKAARRWVEQMAPSWTVCEVEPRHTLWLRPTGKRAPSARKIANLRSDLAQWAREERDIEIAVDDHPTIPGMLRVEVAGRLSEETFHLWDDGCDVWALDPVELRAARRQAEPVLCATCAGKGCEACDERGITPSPIEGP